MCLFVAFRFLILLSIGFVLTGCARGVVEFQAYSQAFSAQYAEGELVLDNLAKAERIFGLTRIKRDARGTIPAFDPKYAAYYVDGVDPPMVGFIRGSIRALKAYNEALAGLANGEAAEAMTAKLGQITSNLISAGVAAYSASLSPAASAIRADQWAGQAAKDLNIALPIFQKVATFAAQEAFREQLVRAYPDMRGLLVTLRAGTPQMFALFERSLSERLNTKSGLSPEREALLEKYRTQLAGWVLLLDRSLEAMDAAAAAAMNDMPALELARMADVSLEIRVLAEKVKLQRNK